MLGFRSSSAVQIARALRPLLLASVLGVASSCGELTAPSLQRWTLTVDSIFWTDELTPPDRVPVVTTTAEGLRVTHNIITSYICDPVAGSIISSASGVMIRVVATRHEGGCYAVGGNHRWVATGPATTGPYRVVVIHEFPKQTRGTQVLLDTVLVLR